MNAAFKTRGFIDKTIYLTHTIGQVIISLTFKLSEEKRQENDKKYSM